jgi:hypothetical protein
MSLTPPQWHFPIRCWYKFQNVSIKVKTKKIINTSTGVVGIGSEELLFFSVLVLVLALEGEASTSLDCLLFFFFFQVSSYYLILIEESLTPFSSASSRSLEKASISSLYCCFISHQILIWGSFCPPAKRFNQISGSAFVILRNILPTNSVCLL